MTTIVYVHPTFNVISCKTKHDEESCGMMGCHSFERCPACRKEPVGFEFWNEYGYRVGGIKPDENLAEAIDRREKMRNETFRAGGTQYWAGGWDPSAIGPEWGIPKED